MTAKKSNKRNLYKEIKSGMKSLKGKRECKCDKADIHLKIVLDRSGSMEGCKWEVIGGFNEYISKLKKDKKANYTVSLVRFDTEYEVVYKELPIKNVPDLDESNFVPRGMTALNDAIGKTIVDSGSVPKGSAALLVIFTDGAENASKEFSVEQVRNLVKSREAEGNWTVVYIGSDLNSQRHAISYGTSANNFLSYTSTGAGTRSAFTNLASNTASYSTNVSKGISNSTNFFVPDQDASAGTSVVVTGTAKKPAKK